jgi:hypothetical protein
MSPIEFEPSGGGARVDVKYVVIVAVLVAVILIALTQLWLIERHRRIAAEDRLIEMYLQEQLRAAGDLPATPPAASGPVTSQAP